MPRDPPGPADPINPYQPPAATDSDAVGSHGPAHYTYQPLTPLTTVLVASLALCACLDVLHAIAHVEPANRLAQMRAGSMTYAEAKTGDLLPRLLDLSFVAALVATMVAFCFFLPRANRNVRALGSRSLRYGPRWTVGLFFVPIVSLYKPYQAVKEIWKASEPRLDVPWRETNPPAFFPIWWISWISWGFVSRIVDQELRGYASANAMWLLAIETSLLVVAAATAILVVRGIDVRQAERRRAVEREESA